MQISYIFSMSWGTFNGQKWNLMKEKPLTEERGNIIIIFILKIVSTLFQKISDLQHVSSNFKCNA
jgi:hypothetical protein